MDLPLASNHIQSIHEINIVFTKKRNHGQIWKHVQCRHKVLNYYWRCSHSNFIFANPIKTYETLILFGSKSRFVYKSYGKP